jgi:hypothetical protein
MSSFNKLKGMAGASVVAGAGLIGMMASSARAGVKTSFTGSNGGYLTFHDADKDWAHGFYFSGSNSSVVTDYYSSISEGAIGKTSSCTTSVTTFWSCYSYSDAYDGVLGLEVNSNGFSPVFAEVVVSDYQIDAGSNVDIDTDLDASVKWAFLKDSPVTRGLFSVMNKSAVDQSVTLSVYGNWGADGQGGIIDTSNGDQVVDNTDTWVTIADDLVNGDNSDPVITTGISGPGSTVTTTVVDLDTSNYVIDYTFDVPAGATRSIVAFHEMSKDITGAAGIASHYESGSALNQANLLAGLTNSERSRVVNYALPQASVAEDTRARSSSGGSAGAAFMALIAGMGIARRRTKR